MNSAGGVDADAAALGTAAQGFAGPMALGSAEIKCGAFPKQPGLCGAQTRVFEHVGGGTFKALTDWLSPAGM